jgi:Uma2 family endonuclease
MAAPPRRATLADLARAEGKAELVGGRLVQLMPTGIRPNEIGGNIYVSLRDYARQTGRGKVFMDNIGYTVPVLPSGRESFSPDASYYAGVLPANLMRFVEGPPTFAAEVRSENSYGPAAVAEMAAKRDDYFQAGTQVVWDVDPLAETITCYRANDPNPAVFRRGDVADAEHAVPGWRIPVDEVFA